MLCLTKSRCLVIFSMMAMTPSASQASVAYTYDGLGRVATALYDNNLCLSYTYDANGNRTARVVTAAGSPNSPVWGTGVWGCFRWSS